MGGPAGTIIGGPAGYIGGGYIPGAGGYAPGGPGGGYAPGGPGGGYYPGGPGGGYCPWGYYIFIFEINYDFQFSILFCLIIVLTTFKLT